MSFSHQNDSKEVTLPIDAELPPPVDVKQPLQKRSEEEVEKPWEPPSNLRWKLDEYGKCCTKKQLRASMKLEKQDGLYAKTYPSSKAYAKYIQRIYDCVPICSDEDNKDDQALRTRVQQFLELFNEYHPRTPQQRYDDGELKEEYDPRILGFTASIWQFASRQTDPYIIRTIVGDRLHAAKRWYWLDIDEFGLHNLKCDEILELGDQYLIRAIAFQLQWVLKNRTDKDLSEAQTIYRGKHIDRQEEIRKQRQEGQDLLRIIYDLIGRIKRALKTKPNDWSEWLLKNGRSRQDDIERDSLKMESLEGKLRMGAWITWRSSPPQGKRFSMKVEPGWDHYKFDLFQKTYSSLKEYTFYLENKLHCEPNFRKDIAQDSHLIGKIVSEYGKIYEGYNQFSKGWALAGYSGTKENVKPEYLDFMATVLCFASMQTDPLVIRTILAERVQAAKVNNLLDEEHLENNVYAISYEDIKASGDKRVVEVFIDQLPWVIQRILGIVEGAKRSSGELWLARINDFIQKIEYILQLEPNNWREWFLQHRAKDAQQVLDFENQEKSRR